MKQFLKYYVHKLMLWKHDADKGFLSLFKTNLTSKCKGPFKFYAFIY